MAVPCALALLPLLLLVRLCVQRHVDVPFYDQWALVPRLEHMHAGTLTFQDFWAQHNEHRTPIPILVMLTLARLSRWNIGWEIAVNVLLGAGIFLVFARYVRSAWNAHGGPPWWLLPVMSVLVFSRVQWENWLWGWQMSALMGTFAAIWGLYCLSPGSERRWHFPAALACGVWSLYSFGAGLVYWVAGPIAIALGPPAQRRRRLIAWAVAGGATIGIYFYHYTRVPGPSPLASFASVEAFATLAKYVLEFLGGPVAWYSQAAAFRAGAIVFVAFIGLAVWLQRWGGEAVFRFPFVVGVQTIGSAVLSGLGRAWMGGGQSMSSRYTTFAVPLWCAAAALAVLAWRVERTRIRRLSLWALTTAALVAVVISATMSGREGARIAAGRSESLRFARRGLIVGRSQALLLMLYPNVDVIKEQRAVLRRLRLSVFRPSPANSYPLPGPL